MGCDEGKQPARWPTLAAYRRDVDAVRGPRWETTRVQAGRLEGVVSTPSGWLQDPTQYLQPIFGRLDPVRARCCVFCL